MGRDSGPSPKEMGLSDKDREMMGLSKEKTEGGDGEAERAYEADPRVQEFRQALGAVKEKVNAVWERMQEIGREHPSFRVNLYTATDEKLRGLVSALGMAMKDANTKGGNRPRDPRTSWLRDQSALDETHNDYRDAKDRYNWIKEGPK